MTHPLFSKNPSESSAVILEMIDELVDTVSDSELISPAQTADKRVTHLEAAVNLYAGAKYTIAAKLIDIFSNKYEMICSIARENGARTNEEAFNLIGQAVGLEQNISYWSMWNLKDAICKTIPNLKKHVPLTPQDEIEIVMNFLRENAESKMIIGNTRLARIARDAVREIENGELDPSVMQSVAQSLKSGEATQELKDIVNDIRVKRGMSPSAMPEKIFCKADYGKSGTVFTIEVDPSSSEMVERILKKYFDIKPY